MGLFYLDVLLFVVGVLAAAPRIFFAPLAGVWTEMRKELSDLDAKHARQTSGRV